MELGTIAPQSRTAPAANLPRRLHASGTTVAADNSYTQLHLLRISIALLVLSRSSSPGSGFLAEDVAAGVQVRVQFL